MTYTRTSITKTLSAVVITCAVAAFYTAPVAAQNATGLNCSGCVKSKHLKNGGVKNKDLKDNAINSQKIADGTVGNADLSGDSVTGDKVQDGALTGADVQDSSLTGADIQNGSVTGADVSNLTGSDINTGSVPSTDISNEAGVDFRHDSADTIAFVDKTVISDTLTAPASGFVTVIVNGYFQRDASTTDARCSIRAGALTTVDFNNEIQARLSTTTDLIPFSLVRTFSQSGGTTQTYRVNCDVSAVLGTAFVREMNIALIFHPTRY